MYLVLLEDFIAAGTLESFSRAALSRGSTQSAFSRRIRTLEDWVGTPLFERSTHPAAMTQAGKAFLPVAEGIVHRLVRARHDISGDEPSGSRARDDRGDGGAENRRSQTQDARRKLD